MGRKRRRSHSASQVLLGVALGLVAIATVAWTIHAAREPSEWQHVYATREGEIGKKTSTGLTITPSSMFVALPHRMALGKEVEVRCGARAIVVPVLDVGPWNIDDAYWTDSRRPAAEQGRGYYRTPVNRAGIDLSDPVFAALGLRDNGFVEWRFVHKGYLILPWL